MIDSGTQRIEPIFFRRIKDSAQKNAPKFISVQRIKLYNLWNAVRDICPYLTDCFEDNFAFDLLRIPVLSENNLHPKTLQPLYLLKITDVLYDNALHF